MLGFLSDNIKKAILNLEYDLLYEIRIRANKGVIVNYKLQNLYLTQNGVSVNNFNSINVNQKELSDLIYTLCENSIYSYTEQIKQGFISLKSGIRVGLCGECVTENGKILNLKDITSINIRIPHAVNGCSRAVFSYYKTNVLNTLIISPPGVGKTTFIRDLAKEISQKLYYNVLICDERNEIFPLIDAVDTVDVIKFSPKEYAFENGIRAMSPDVIVTDEITTVNDVKAIIKAINSGVKVVASMHGNDEKVLLKHSDFMLLSDYFELIVVLSCKKGKGTLEKVVLMEKLNDN